MSLKAMPLNQSKTILHLIDTTGPGGAETVFIQLADRLRDIGYQSVVVISGKGWVEQSLKKRGLEPYIIPAKGSFAVGFLRQLMQLVKKHQVDIIQSHLLGSNVYAAMVGMLTRTPVVATYHGMVDVNPNERFRLFKNKVMRWGIKRYVAVSQRLLKNIQERGLLDSRKACVIYNGVDLKRYNQQPTNQLRDKLSIPEGAILAGSLGNIRPAKAYHVLIESASLLIKQYPHLHFVIAGHQKPKLMNQLQSQIDEANLQDHFHFLGFCDDTAEFLLQMDLFVLSSSSEGFSIATIEAMAAKLPAVVTRCGGPEEIITPEKNGLMVDVDNPKALAEGITRLIESPDLCNALVEQAYRHVEKTFTIDAMLESYHQEYQNLVT
jgi:glycosyltransferase involved in cell wall biosynthesis